MGDELSWLQQWYFAHCDGEWEHGFGIKVETLDNPGWTIEIDLEGTELMSAPFEPVQQQTTETDWVICRVVEPKEGRLWQAPLQSLNCRRFEGHGGPSNLSDIIAVFRTWAEGSG